MVQSVLGNPSLIPIPDVSKCVKMTGKINMPHAYYEKVNNFLFKEKVDKSVDVHPQTYKCVNKIRDNLFLQGGREGIVSELTETLE